MKRWPLARCAWRRPLRSPLLRTQGPEPPAWLQEGPRKPGTGMVPTVTPTSSAKKLPRPQQCPVKVAGARSYPPPPVPNPHTQPTTRNQAIISNSLLSSSYAQQLLNFGGNFQKILSVSLSEIACPDAPYKKNPESGKNSKYLERKVLRNNQSCQFHSTVSSPKISGLKMLKVPDAIIRYSYYCHAPVFTEIHVNFHLYVKGISLHTYTL